MGSARGQVRKGLVFFLFRVNICMTCKYKKYK
jgi:hypothetical protein